MPSKRPFEVVLYGATGFTGKLIARELEKHGVDFAIAGRDEGKLNNLSASLKSQPSFLVASVEDEASLVSMAGKGKVLISAAGPFAKIGMPVARAAVKAKTHYLDTTGEQGFVRQVVEELDGPAQKAGVALAPAMGFDVVPGDVAVFMAVKALSKRGKAPWVAAAEVIYKVRPGRLTRGTTKSLLGVLADNGFIFRDGRYVEVGSGNHVKDIQFPGSDKVLRAVLSPLAEIVTVPRSIRCDHVSTYMSMSKSSERAMALLGPALGQIAKLDNLNDLLDKGINLLPEGPEPKDREEAKWQILGRVETRDGQTSAVLASGRDPYGLTGELLAVYAKTMAANSFKGKGVLSPSQVASPEKVLGTLKDFPITFEEI